MNYHVMTLFPDMITNAMSESITGRALKAGYLALEAVNIRDFADNKHNRVDDYPYGGGAGMVMQAEPVYRCYEDIMTRIREQGGSAAAKVIYLTPQGKVFDQQMAKEYAPFVRKIEVEVENLDMVKEAVEAGADIIMLDNMSPEDMKKAVELIDGRAQTECSGNVTKENIARLTEIGVDYISSGALTHSAPILDISLKNLHAVE